MNFHHAYVLHRYPYRETSFLLKVLTQEEGLITLVARHAKRAKSDWYSLLQPFQALSIAYQGKGSVLTLTQAERVGHVVVLQNQSLWAGFYLNELLLKFLAPHDVHAALFEIYQEAISALHAATLPLEQILRNFELQFFVEMGLLPDLTADQAGDALQEDAWYQLERQHLPQKRAAPDRALPHYFRGDELIALRERNFSDPHYLKTAKRFSRLWLEFYGLGRELRTREIFAAVFHREGDDQPEQSQNTTE